jgi:tetratricopeptide (TPR) repeat protein
LYEEALKEDPEYAPLWARLGRLYRLIWKYSGDPDSVHDLDRADAALKRALELDPDLAMALNYYAHHEIELGRPREALVRLLERSGRLRSDPHLFAGLVQACRYCGLLEASIAAHAHVRRLDRTMPTSVAQTLFLKGDYVRALEAVPGGPAPGLAAIILSLLGRDEEALASIAADEAQASNVAIDYLNGVRFAIQGRRDEAQALARRYLSLRVFIDSEGLFHMARLMSRVGDQDGAIEALTRSADAGYCGLPALVQDAWFDPVRTRPDFRRLLERAEVQRRAGLDAFIVAGGERLLGVTAH